MLLEARRATTEDQAGAVETPGPLPLAPELAAWATGPDRTAAAGHA